MNTEKSTEKYRKALETAHELYEWNVAKTEFPQSNIDGWPAHVLYEWLELLNFTWNLIDREWRD